MNNLAKLTLYLKKIYGLDWKIEEQVERKSLDENQRKGSSSFREGK